MKRIPYCDQEEWQNSDCDRWDNVRGLLACLQTSSRDGVDFDRDFVHQLNDSSINTETEI
jgi:hypothetical protein